LKDPGAARELDHDIIRTSELDLTSIIQKDESKAAIGGFADVYRGDLLSPDGLSRKVNSLCYVLSLLIYLLSTRRSQSK
jgi:hypothetical protein